MNLLVMSSIHSVYKFARAELFDTGQDFQLQYKSKLEFYCHFIDVWS